MKKTKSVVLSLSLFLVLLSCKKKKLIEVVEVPLPTKESKVTIGNPEDVSADKGIFKMVSLPYLYDALDPEIDAMTMDIHYSKHYLTYTNDLNKALKETEFSEDNTIEEVLSKLDINNSELRNNAGGYYNHSLFFESLKPNTELKPSDTLAKAIVRDFGSFESFKVKFKDAANEQFGSGWAWLLVDKTGKLQITSTPNQDNPLMPKQIITGTPILGLDVWEHAYYLNYQYKRQRYIENFFKIINWEKVSKRYTEAIKKS